MPCLHSRDSRVRLPPRAAAAGAALKSPPNLSSEPWRNRESRPGQNMARPETGGNDPHAIRIGALPSIHQVGYLPDPFKVVNRRQRGAHHWRNRQPPQRLVLRRDSTPAAAAEPAKDEARGGLRGGNVEHETVIPEVASGPSDVDIRPNGGSFAGDQNDIAALEDAAARPPPGGAERAPRDRVVDPLQPLAARRIGIAADAHQGLSQGAAADVRRRRRQPGPIQRRPPFRVNRDRSGTNRPSP